MTTLPTRCVPGALPGLLLLAARAGAAPAHAQTPCLEDAARVCPGIPVGDGRLYRCLVAKQFQLSSRCVEHIREVQRRAAEFTADCAPDVYRFGPTVRTGEGRLLECLGAYVGRRELSSNCEDAVVSALEKLQAFSDACANDAARLCAGVQPGRGRLFLCLLAASDQLSSQCRSAVRR